MRKTEHVTVKTIDAIIQFDVKSNATIRDVNSEVNKVLGIREPIFFGVKVMENGKPRWPKDSKKVSSFKRDGAINFIFGIKLYFGDVNQVLDEKSLYYFYKEVKHLVVSGELYCQPEMALALASRQAVIELGPYNSSRDKFDSINLAHYIPSRVLKQYDWTEDEWKAKIFELYKTNDDLATDEYLEIAQELYPFGLEYFPVTNAKNTNLLLAVGINGLSIYPEDDRINPLINFPWYEMKSVSYRDTKLIVKPVDRSKDLVFNTPTKIDCSNILVLAEGYYRLQSSINSESTIETQHLELEAKARRQARAEDRQRRLYEREKNRLLEHRVAEAERAMAEKDAALLNNLELLSLTQRQLDELQIQLEKEQKLRQDLDSMNAQLESVNKRLELDIAVSADERNRLMTERDKVLFEIKEQNYLIDQQELEKKEMEEKLNNLKASQTENSIDLKPMKAPPEDNRVPMMAVDEGFKKHLDKLTADMQKSRKQEKLEKVDRDFEIAKGTKVDKYKTLKNIRNGNTKHRVEQFESM